MTAGWNPGGKMLAVARAFFLFPVMGLCNLSCCFLVTRDAIRQVFESSFFSGLQGEPICTAWFGTE